MRTIISVKNVIVLPQDLCEPHFSKGATFCLEVAAKNNIVVNEIWILGDDVPQGDAISKWFPNADILTIKLDKKRWPLDVASNQKMQLPPSLYAALQDAAPKRIIAPLRGASAYFPLIARGEGLLDADCEIIQTCYLPTVFEGEGLRLLPTELTVMLNVDPESWCAKNGDILWITHDELKETIASEFDMDINKIRALPLKHPKLLPSLTKHIVFSGTASPLHGFDVFIDLAESLDEHIEQISVFLDETPSHKPWRKSDYKRLHKLKAKLNWHPGTDIYDHKDSLTDAILICAMRAPIYPLAARAVQKSGMRILWGTGLEQPTTNIKIKTADNVYPVVSDARELKSKLLEIWDIE